MKNQSGNMLSLSSDFSAVATLLTLLSLPCQIGAIKLDSAFHDLFSLSHTYDDVKYGDIPHLRDAFLANHLSENTARLLYGLARAFTRSKISSQKQFLATPYKTSTLPDSVCNNRDRYSNHKMPDVTCHFHIFTICVEGLLERPDICLEPVANPACPQAPVCLDAYQNLVVDLPRAWLQLWAEETTNNLLKYKHLTASQIAALPKKSCLHDSQFLSAVFNLALCSEISRQASLSEPRIVHPLAEIYCPDPCLRSPCAGSALKHQLLNTSCSTEGILWESQHAIAHRWDDLMLQREQGIRPQYTCRCRIGRWIASKQACERVDGGSYQTCAATLANRHFPCSPEGTSMCFDNKESEEVPFICRCKPGYVGMFCQEKQNACFHTAMEIKLHDQVVQLMTGNRMCNVNNGGEPIVGSTAIVNTCQVSDETRDGYSCKCTGPYHRQISLEADNCLGVKRACDAELCVNGECISSPDLMTAGACRCHEGWGGDHCDRVLADWGVWTACRPVCGANRTRQRERMGDRRQFKRPFLETETCPNRYCRDDTDEAEYTAYQTLLHASCADSAALTGSILMALLSFSLLRFWQPRFASREARGG